MAANIFSFKNENCVSKPNWKITLITFSTNRQSFIRNLFLLAFVLERSQMFSISYSSACKSQRREIRGYCAVMYEYYHVRASLYDDLCGEVVGIFWNTHSTLQIFRLLILILFLIIRRGQEFNLRDFQNCLL